MVRRSGRRLVSTAALLSAIGLTAACGESPERADAGGPGAVASTAAGKSERSGPLTAVELKAALLTAEQAVGFEITDGRSRDGAVPESSFDAKETVSPEVCRHVKEATSGDGEEAAAASSDQDPADWMPLSPDAECRYVAEWVSTKLRWQLTADDRELEALKVYADGPCEDTIVRYTPAA
ncbi:hypothetical protein ACH4F3_35700 [Streptomyces anulatus]